MRADTKRTETGVALVMFVLMLTLLLAFAGFAVDLGNWYLVTAKMQRAADAAALAGSVYLPDDLSSAQATATAALASNGFAGAAAITQDPTRPARLDVTVSETVDNYFFSLLGMPTTNLSDTSTAQYRKPVVMGSPDNVLGQEPSYPGFGKWEKAQDVGAQGYYWMDISGGETPKENGDRWTADQCGAAHPDNCDPSQPVPWSNGDYDAGGEQFVVRVARGTIGAVSVQAFDPEFAENGDENCSLDAATTALNPVLYAPGIGQFCTGDEYAGNGTSGPGVDTTFQLYTPANTAGGSQPMAACPPQTYGHYKPPFAPQLDPSLSTYDPTFADTFRKWVDLCTFNIGGIFPSGDYILHVTTPATSGGQNRFALRAAVVDGSHNPKAAETQGIEIFSPGRLSVYANSQNSTATVPLARVDSGEAGQTLTLSAFDLGDASKPVTITITPPPDATSGGGPLTSFAGCTQTRPNSSTYISTALGCVLSNVSKDGTGGEPGYDGKLIKIQVPLPSDYRCADAAPDGCWIRFTENDSDGFVHDTSSWTTGFSGSPVRLVQP